MIIRSAEFVTSAVKPSQYPDVQFPEVAFAGRSNVGKSSMINTLVNRKGLVKTSQKPGKTQLVNFFDVNQNLRMVDLPGYGYAKVPMAVKKKWGPMIESYLDGRSSLCGVFLLLDIRREPKDEEWQLIDWLVDRELPARIVLTKADKFTRNHAFQRKMKLAKALDIDPDHLVLFSSVTKQGRDEVWQTICNMTGVPWELSKSEKEQAAREAARKEAAEEARQDAADVLPEAEGNTDE